MNDLLKHLCTFKRIGLMGALSLLSYSSCVSAASMALPNDPIYLSESVPPLTMLVMGRDHKLYYEAYNDASDLNGDGKIDVGYEGYHCGVDNPASDCAQKNVDYYGYFNSYACYDYNSATGRFEPKSAKTAAEVTAKKKTCAGGTAGEWSGDFLNYLTTARIDAVRKVLYGGRRSTDTTTETVLERTHIPQDAHSWGKEYHSSTRDGYDISQYTNLSLPAAGTYHVFANVSLNSIVHGSYGSMNANATPRLRVLSNTSHRVWEWLSKERPVAGAKCINGLGGSEVDCVRAATPASTMTDYVVRVQVCTSIDATISDEANSCIAYPSGSYKPTGILNEFGENDSMMFGLLSGSYQKNLDGGVLRKAVSSFTDEVNLTTGVHNTATNGIISTLNNLKVTSFNDSGYSYSCGWITTRPISGNECEMWGNPVAEMLYETLRYFSGKASATSDFTYSNATSSRDYALGLREATWSDPYHPTTGYQECAKPFQLVMSDINPSYDTDKIPGADSSFGSSFSGDISGLNASALADTITSGEGNIAGNSFFIGQSGTNIDNAPTAKSVASLASLRGIAPEEPTKLGGYYSASMAYYGYTNDLHATADGNQKLQTFAVALASPLPTISIDPDNNPATNNSVTVVPFAKSVGGGPSATGSFQPTNQIVDFYVESLDATSGSFLVNFEDVEQGADHDMDAIARYSYSVNTSSGAVTITVDSIYAAGGIDQHMGYVISGTTRDGVYLEVKDRGGRDIVYKLDTPASIWAGDARGTTLLGLTNTRTFNPSLSGTSASFLKDPLWYAAKWSGFKDSKESDGSYSGTPNHLSEYDGEDAGSDPDNYFLVTNALTLKKQMKAAFQEIFARSSSSSTVTVSTGSLKDDSLLFQAVFNTQDWTGDVRAIEFQGAQIGQSNWKFADQLDAQLKGSGGHNTQREIITMKEDGTGVPFRFPVNDYLNPADDEISTAQANLLLSGTSRDDNQDYGRDLVNYLRGDISEEKGVSGAERNFRSRRPVSKIEAVGDIVNSDPLFVPRPGFFYYDTWPTSVDSTSVTAPENDANAQKYSAFRALLKQRKPVIYVGSNNGMLHAINAYKNEGSVTDGGKEILAYVPKAIYAKLPALADPNYVHDYYVDGKTTYSDVFFSDKKWHTTLVGTLHGGGQGLFALDITDPKGISQDSAYPSFDESNAEEIALWEFSDEDDPDLGFTYGRPTIVRLANGQWGAIFGNGYDNTHPDGVTTTSTTGNAALYIVNIETGALIKKFDTLVGTSADPTGSQMPNGMSEPAPIDIDGDFIADYVYAGDLFGNLWKIDISNPNSSNWDFAFKSGSNPAPLYVAQSAGGARLAITHRPMVGSHPKFGRDGDVMVYFGTGRYLVDADNLSTGQNTQSVFGIWDDGTNGKTRANLLAQSFFEKTVEDDDPDDDVKKPEGTFRIVSNNPIYWEDQENGDPKHDGWVMDLIDTELSPADNKGERNVNNMILRDGKLTITTLIPSNDPCLFGGSGWVMVIDAADGSQIDYASIDSNEDGDFTTDDMIDTDDDGEGDQYASSAVHSSGVITMPAQVDNNGVIESISGNSNVDDVNNEESIDRYKQKWESTLNKRLFWRELK